MGVKVVKYLFEIQEKIVPELITLAEIRYTILRTIYYNQPIGRRNLAEKLDLSERKVRNELEFLQSKKLVKITKAGSRITENGTNFLKELDDYIKEIKDIRNLESQMKIFLGLQEVYVVPGELEYASLKEEIGRYTAVKLKNILKNGDILAVTGGETLAQVANSMRIEEKFNFDITVVPGRGGLGEKVEIQSNTIVAKIAKKLGGKYRLLHIPDNIRKENISMIKAEPSIQETLQLLSEANILLHGVGEAEKMASRRGMTSSQIQNLLDQGAIGEAFGYYFNRYGEIVHSTTSVGLSLEDLKDIDQVIAVAGGENKVEAIISAVSPEFQDMLITDEVTARKILDSR